MEGILIILTGVMDGFIVGTGGVIMGLDISMYVVYLRKL